MMELDTRAVERPRDAGWAEVATLAGRCPARVDWAGLVSSAGAGWSVDWWVGADDRWYLPAREPTIRQRRRGAGPVIETTMRIPSGDARHVAYGALTGGREATVIEITNDSPVPVALAVALRPYGVGSSSASCGFDAPLHLDRTVVRAGPTPLLVLPRPPSHAGASNRRDLLPAVQAGEDLAWEAPASGRTANAVVLFPLPHRTSLRVLVLSPGLAGRDARGETGGPTDPSAGLDPRSAPDPDAVARGWTSVVEAGARFELPDPGLTELTNGARARLLLAAPSLGRGLAALEPGSGAVLAALAAGGHGLEVATALAALADAFPTRLAAGPLDGAEIVAALALAATAFGRVREQGPPLARLVETGAQITHLVERSGSAEATAMAKRGLAQLVRTLDPVGADRLEAGLGPPPAVSLAQVNDLAALASPAGAWGGAQGDDPVAAGRFVTAARSMLIDDSGPDLVLLPQFPSSWRGGVVEVRDAPTRHGRLSFAIRWHGYRPALLWQLDGGPVDLRSPALDPGWVAGQPRGEALLSGSADDLPLAPQPGDSFS